mmetsp:Transcript_14505/g.60528  ORF Transcript_14505/g.60528 Transcript_14505/m.60528 type:complete len:96 (-) Transcript_14505:91-378(-)
MRPRVRSPAAHTCRAALIPRPQELVAVIEESNRTQLQMRFARQLRQPFNASNFRKLKKTIAIAKTIMREREIEAGVKPRQSRAAKRKAQAANLMF